MVSWILPYSGLISEVIIVPDDLLSLVSFSEFVVCFGVMGLLFLETTFKSTADLCLSLKLFGDDGTLLEHLLNVDTGAVFGEIPVIAFLLVLAVDPFPSTDFLHAFTFHRPYLSSCSLSISSPSSLFSSLSDFM